MIPSGLTARVRGIEVHGAAVERAIAGHRAALNLGGDRGRRAGARRSARASRPGRAVAHPRRRAPLPADRAGPARAAHQGARPPRHRAGARHARAGRGRPRLAPGGHALAQLRIDATTPLGALPGDRFIVRGFVTTSTHGSTIGGGRIVRVLAPKARRGVEHAATVASLASARHDQRIALDVKSAACGRGHDRRSRASARRPCRHAGRPARDPGRRRRAAGHGRRGARALPARGHGRRARGPDLGPGRWRG